MTQKSNKKKVSDGIHPSRIKKATTLSSNVRESFVLMETKNDDLNVPRKFEKFKRKKDVKDIIVNDYLNSNYKNFNKVFFLKNFLAFFINRKKFFKNIIFILLYCYILFFIFNKLEETKITLKPRTESISKIEKINSYLKPEYGQLGFSIMMLSDSRKQTVNAEKKVIFSEKASGKITIFNNYSTEPQRLSPKTRFKSVSGKIFKTSDNWIEIPGKTKKGPGSIDVFVYASEPGQEYNLDVTDFVIPGFKEAGLIAKYNDIYALSLSPFVGGFNGEKLIVSDKQKKEVTLKLENELKKILTNELTVEKTDRAILVDNSVQILFKEPIIREEDNGKYTIEQDAQIFAILIEKKNLENFLRKRYLPKVINDDVYLLNTNNINFNYLGGKINFKNLKKVNIKMNVKSTFQWRINTDLVKESLLGLDKKDIPNILSEFEEIDSAEIQIQPFWQKHISDNINHIKILK